MQTLLDDVEARLGRVRERHLLIEPAAEAKARAALLRLGHPLEPPS